MIDAHIFEVTTIPTSFRGYNKQVVEQKLRIIQSEYNKIENNIDILAKKFSALEESMYAKNQEFFELEKENNNLLDEINTLNAEIIKLKKNIHTETINEPIIESEQYESIQIPEPLVEAEIPKEEPIIYNHNSFSEDEDVLIGDVETKIIDESFRIGNDDLTDENEGFTFV